MLGAVVPIYNLPGRQADLKLRPDVLADIYLGKITNWNDARIAKDNPGVKLPDQTIIVVHRSDGSGTTFIFTDYLSKVSNDWKNSVGKEHGRPAGPSASAARAMKESPAMVRQMPGAIGYVELIYALQNNIPFGDREERLRQLGQGHHRRRHRCRRQRQDHARRLSRLHHQRARQTMPIRSRASPGC